MVVMPDGVLVPPVPRPLVTLTQSTVQQRKERHNLLFGVWLAKPLSQAMWWGNANDSLSLSLYLSLSLSISLSLSGAPPSPASPMEIAPDCWLSLAIREGNHGSL
jgi:hypothetical protein